MEEARRNQRRKQPKRRGGMIYVDKKRRAYRAIENSVKI